MIVCTEISAGWCPICGDCTCPQNQPGWVNKSDENCKLHSSSSPHGELSVSERESQATVWGTIEIGKES